MPVNGDEDDGDKALLPVNNVNNTEAMEYDEDKVSFPIATSTDQVEIFTHLVFYMDTPENASANELASSKPPEAATKRQGSHAFSVLAHC